MSDAITQVSYSKRSVLLRLNDLDRQAHWDKILTRIGATRNNSSEEPGWILSRDRIDLFEEAMYKAKRSRGRAPESARPRSRFVPKNATPSLGDEAVSSPDARNHSSDEEEYDSRDEESSDDELIQTVLARRLMSESSQKSIETEEILNSDDEDCVSYSRRLRHMYTVIKGLRERIKILEEASL